MSGRPRLLPGSALAAAGTLAALLLFSLSSVPLRLDKASASSFLFKNDTAASVPPVKIEQSSSCLPLSSGSPSLKPRHLVVGILFNTSKPEFCREIESWSKGIETPVYFFYKARADKFSSCGGFYARSVPTLAPVAASAISKLRVEHPKARWTLILFHQAWVHIPRLVQALARYDSQAPLLLGVPKAQGLLSYCSGRSGIVISQGLLHALPSRWFFRSGDGDLLEHDVDLGQAANSLGVGCSHVPGFLEENIAQLLANNAEVFRQGIEESVVNPELYAALQNPIIVPTRDVSRTQRQEDTWTLDFLYRDLLNDGM